MYVCLRAKSNPFYIIHSICHRKMAWCCLRRVKSVLNGCTSLLTRPPCSLQKEMCSTQYHYQILFLSIYELQEFREYLSTHASASFKRGTIFIDWSSWKHAIEQWEVKQNIRQQLTRTNIFIQEWTVEM